ncbi:hypothetical protein TRFO_08687 [Tritrichomonas foetus]|uniref:Uncharacterized protein n=1 Tax=Tritrichomonas foetus TaxID=1144522 RepID=A0A1J4JHW6_9EUKA|nr:hypothetical protein TRFO_08687 [Tritrichomonas foetus]|eukprot:OHS98710.1 hypothetical protein TRFO_08687 [Tritrichomonas foetus]
MLIFLISLAYSFKHCSELNSLPDECNDTPFCRYRNNKCLAYFPGLKIDAEKNSQGSCYTLYDDNGCSKCVSREQGVKCGWCLTLGVCTEGTANGANSLKCAGEDWVFNKTKCDNDFCSKSSSKDKCMMPCQWNGKQCLMGSLLNSYNTPETKSNKNKILFIVGCVVAGVVVVVSVVFMIVKRKKTREGSYESIPMKYNVNLDCLPPAF